MADSDQQDTDRQATGSQAADNLSIAVDVAEAARRLGVTPDAVRARLHRGTLAGEKVDGQWRVQLPTVMLGSAAARTRHGMPGDPTGTQQDATGQPTGETVGTDSPRQDTDRTPTVDLSPLIDEIARLNQRNEELAAAAGMWQSRARYLEERLQQLTATAGEAPGSPEPADTDDHDAARDDDPDSAPPAGIWARLARWWTGTGDRHEDRLRMG